MPIDSDDSVPLVVSALNKGIGPIASPLEPEETLGVGWSLLDEEIALPAAVLYEEKLAHNVRWMRDFMKEYGVKLAPHGKTTMAPKLFGRQMDAGAWGITVANAHQAFVACRHGSTEMAAVFRERHDFAPGSTIHLMPDLDRAHLFDAGSGARLAA